MQNERVVVGRLNTCHSLQSKVLDIHFTHSPLRGNDSFVQATDCEGGTSKNA